MEEKLEKLSAVIIDDDICTLELLREALRDDRVEIHLASKACDGLDLVRAKGARLVLLDIHLPDGNGMDVLEEILRRDPGVEVILMTGNYSTESAVEAIRRGASDYFPKPVRLEKLKQRVDSMLADVFSRRRALQLENELLKAFQFEGMIGRSAVMLEAFAKIRRIAPHFQTALVTGPTGTGKELVAHALHKLSGASGPFVVCNCAAISESLFESELFGYCKGAFTGANQDKLGLAEFANRGTLFLDEIGEMPLNIQAKLLRLIQNKEILRVGSPVAKKLDLRIVAATNRELKSMAAQKTFREDLYYRLNMIEIRLPSLWERKEDLPLLQRHFIDRFSQEFSRPVRGLTRRAQALLGRYLWPGNVRELENVLGSACMMGSGPVIDVCDLPPLSPTASDSSDEMITLEELSRRHARRVLEKLGGNKVMAADTLGISRATLYRLLEDPATSSQAV